MATTREKLSVEVPSAEAGVTNLELFFDLVFVFTITQITNVVREAHDLEGFLRALAILMVTWWMYDGYCWLSNNVGPNSLSTRLPMLAAMAAFLVMAIATPDAAHHGSWAFAVAYLAVVAIHGLQFGRSSLGGSSRAILQVLPLNAAVAIALGLAAGLGGSTSRVGLALAAAIVLVAAVRVQGSGFTLRPEHFAERHQLLIIIALGEIVVASGVGAEKRLDQSGVLGAVLLSITLLASLWWVYFGGDDVRAAEALAEVEQGRVSNAAFWGYSMGHLLHILGLVLVAAGLHEVVAHPTEQLSWRLALLLAAGTALFLVAQVLFRRRLTIHAGWWLLAGAVLAVPTAALGAQVGALGELAALPAVVIVALGLDERRRSYSLPTP